MAKRKTIKSNGYAMEQDLVRSALHLLQAFGCFVWRQNQGGMKTQSGYVRFSHANGISDIIGVMPDGRFLAAEAKMPGNKPTREQRAFLDTINEQGGLGVVFYNLDELADAVKGLAE